MSIDKEPWTATIRRKSGLVEHVCKHGCGHPAAASVDFMQRTGRGDCSVHGCDGCCQTPEWKLKDAEMGYRIANRIIIELNARLSKVMFELFNKMQKEEENGGIVKKNTL